MATAQTTPQTEAQTITAYQRGFDLDSMQEVTLRKDGTCEPITSAQDFVTRLDNKADLILRLMNEAYKGYAQENLASDSSVAWQLVDEDDETGLEVLAPFTGNLISGDKAKSLKATVINFAKLLFGYSKNMVPGNADENRKAKASAKASALAAILSNPAAVEGLKK